jgi:hypothetical protein
MFHGEVPLRVTICEAVNHLQSKEKWRFLPCGCVLRDGHQPRVVPMAWAEGVASDSLNSKSKPSVFLFTLFIRIVFHILLKRLLCYHQGFQEWDETSTSNRWRVCLETKVKTWSGSSG